MQKDVAVPNYPRCPQCGSRFYRPGDDSNTLCRVCRDTVDGIRRGSLEERLEAGFAMQSDDAVSFEKDEDGNGTEPVLPDGSDNQLVRRPG